MTAFSHSLPGFELDWLAVDIKRHAALLSSSGQGPIPCVVVGRLPDLEAAIKALPLLLMLGRCAESPTGRGNYGFWIEPCRRGLFGFDWGPVSVGPYARVTIPSQPVLIDNFSAVAVHKAAKLVTLAVDFGKVAALAPQNLGELYDDGGPVRP
jgi:hypothetical protein